MCFEALMRSLTLELRAQVGVNLILSSKQNNLKNFDKYSKNFRKNVKLEKFST
jgi:hypothetical protein